MTKLLETAFCAWCDTPVADAHRVCSANEDDDGAHCWVVRVSAVRAAILELNAAGILDDDNADEIQREFGYRFDNKEASDG